MAVTRYIDGQAQPKVYRAELFQEGTNAPIANVGENSLPVSVVWSRDSAGLYYLTAASPIFIAGKTFVQMPYVFPTVSYGRTDETRIYIQENNTVDDWLLFHTIQIHIYP